MSFLDALQKSAKQIDKKLARQKKAKWEKITKDAADTFYANKAEPIYHRKKSLYNVGVADYIDGGLDVEVGLDPSRMTQFERSGSRDGLYTLVYQYGWHGGALGAGDSLPHYRRPLWKWTVWGRVADQDEISPEKYVDTHWDEYIDGELKISIQEAIWDVYNEAMSEVSL